MQPITIFVSEKNDYEKLRDDDVVEIKDEAIKVNGDPYDYYIGYNKDGKKIFQYRKETVNVHFF